MKHSESYEYNFNPDVHKYLHDLDEYEAGQNLAMLMIVGLLLVGAVILYMMP